MLNYLSNPFIFCLLLAILSVLLCYIDKCAFKEKRKIIAYVKTFILTYAISMGSIFGHKFITDYISKSIDNNLKTKNPEF